MIILAAAQTIVKPTTAENLEDHYRLAEQAAQQGAQLIIFPELSLTGYEREKAEELAFSPTDSRLDALRELSVKMNITIIAGAPVKMEERLYITAFILSPDHSISLYTKQFLHEGEELFFSSSFDYNPQIKIGDENFSLAICSDIANPVHVASAKQVNSTTYLATIFYTANGITEGHETLEEYARKHSLNVLMSNYAGRAWGLDAGGKSAFWSRDVAFVTDLKNNKEGLLIVKKEEGEWQIKTGNPVKQ